VARYFFDTEFIERPGSIELISIGIVAEDGREFYAESTEVRWDSASDWVLENVRPHLLGGTWAMSRAQIADSVLAWVPPASRPEFWAYNGAYDWVVFCWLFGRLIDLPPGYPRFCRDLKQLAEQLGNPELPVQDGTEHHALADAQWNRQAWQYLNERAGEAREHGSE
jgi:3' exoribonuclease, RNase T-like